MAPLVVMAPGPPKAESAATVMAPLAVAAVVVSELINAPLLLIPAPLRVMAFAIVEPFKSKVAKGRMLMVPVPKGPAVPDPVSDEPALSKPAKI